MKKTEKIYIYDYGTGVSFSMGRTEQIIATAAYIACIWFTVLGDSRILRQTMPSIGTYAKIISMTAILIAALHLIVHADFRQGKRFGYYFIIMALPIAFAFLWSAGIWIVKLSDISMMIKGCTKLFYQSINVLVVLSAIYMFREKSINYTFYGLIMGNITLVAIALPRFGISASIQSVIDGITGGTSSSYGFMNAMEINDLTFAIGMFVLYYLLFGWEKKYNIFLILAGTFFFLLGFKRIAFAGLAWGICIGLFLKIFKEKTRANVITVLGFFYVAFCFAYVGFVVSGQFTVFMRAHGIEMMGRNTLYEIARNFCSLDITFIGHGMETAGTLVSKASGGALNAVHNDILVAYIEFGFVGFFLWYIYHFVVQSRFFSSFCNSKTATVYMVCISYMLLTYMTDNTFFYYWDSMCLRLIPIAFSFNFIESDIVHKEEINSDASLNHSSLL
ncbi:MAG: hypothetical protein Q8873_03245 [Bacillota bacterium]|nr:hypothetical protein [Bacillota bacterium]